jgi:hypothetical protein
MWDFIGSTWFFVIGGVLLVALIGLFIFLRSKGSGEDE